MNWMHYVLKVNVMLLVLGMIYRLVLKDLTFFRWNRFYLLASVFLSLFLPLLKGQWGSQLAARADLYSLDLVYADHLAKLSSVATPESESFTGGALWLVLYLLVAIVLLGFSLSRFRGLRRTTRHALKIQNGKVKIFIQDIRPGSFTVFRRIYLDRHGLENPSKHVLAHEMVHATQLHSLDLLIFELLGILLWFNPFIFLLKRYVRDNHEYLADEYVCRNRASLVDYLACLRAETVRCVSPAIANYFKSSTIKKRIIMLTSHHSKNHKKWRYLATLPVIALLTLSFQAPLETGIIGIPHEHESMANADALPSLFPLPEQHKGDITWGYGQKAIHPFTRKETTHRGVDIKAPTGTQVFATAEGIVLKAGIFDGWGKMVVIKHGEEFESIYAHLDDYRVEAGHKVERGEVIGGVGNSGQSTGSHLHFEIRKEGKHVNPADYY